MIFLLIIKNDVIRKHLENIYILYAKELVYTSFNIVHDYHEAEDIVQTAFIKASNYIDENTDVKSNKTRGLLIIIVRRLSYNVYNTRKSRKDVNIDEIGEYLIDDKIESPEMNIMRIDDRKKVARLLCNINEGYMDILTLKYLYDYSDLVIASILNMTEGNVRTKLSRARKACLKIIGGERLE